MGQGRRKDCPDVAPRIRRAFITACKRNGGSSYLASKVEASLEKDFIGTLNALAKFNPKVQNVNQTNTLQINVDASVIDWLDGFQAGSKAEALANSPVEAIEHVPQAAVEPADATIDVNPTLPHTIDIEEEDEPVARPSKAPDYPPISQANPADLAKMRSS